MMLYMINPTEDSLFVLAAGIFFGCLALLVLFGFIAIAVREHRDEQRKWRRLHEMVMRLAEEEHSENVWDSYEDTEDSDD